MLNKCLWSVGGCGGGGNPLPRFAVLSPHLAKSQSDLTCFTSATLLLSLPACIQHREAVLAKQHRLSVTGRSLGASTACDLLLLDDTSHLTEMSETGGRSHCCFT